MGIRTSIVLVLTALFVSIQGIIGADCYWAVALGNAILHKGHIPEGVPFAAAATRGWPNVPALAELVFAAMNHAGPGMLLVAQLVAVAMAMGLLSIGARSLGAEDAETAATLLVLTLGALPSMAVVRLQLVSLVPFALLVLLLRRQDQVPSAGIWLMVPLFAVWGNLHGAVLVGLAVACAYLAFSRVRRDPGVAISVCLASVAAIHANPAGFDTWRYYAGVLRNEAAQRHSDLWARPSLDSGFDILMMGSTVVLILLTLRRRRPLWEYIAVAGLGVGTALTARNGLWLLMFCSAAAAAGLTSQRPFHGALQRQRDSAKSSVVLLALGLTVATVSSVHRGADVVPVSDRATLAVVKLAAGGVLLAPEPAAESFAAGGATVWMANPIDAFGQSDQAAYLDFLAGGPQASRAVASADLVVAHEGTALAKRLARSVRLHPVPDAPGWLFFKPTL
jgi:hypothetical protein